jgi:hypothetical protein
MFAAQEHGNIRVAVDTMSSPRPAAIDNSASHAVTTAQQGEKAPNGFLCVVVNSSHRYLSQSLSSIANIIDAGFPLRKKRVGDYRPDKRQHPPDQVMHDANARLVLAAKPENKTAAAQRNAQESGNAKALNANARHHR